MVAEYIDWAKVIKMGIYKDENKRKKTKMATGNSRARLEMPLSGSKSAQYPSPAANAVEEERKKKR